MPAACELVVNPIGVSRFFVTRTPPDLHSLYAPADTNWRMCIVRGQEAWILAPHRRCPRRGKNRTECACCGAKLADLSAPRGQIGQRTLARLVDCPFSPISAGKSAKERRRTPRSAKKQRGRAPRNAKKAARARRSGVQKSSERGRRGVPPKKPRGPALGGGAVQRSSHCERIIESPRDLHQRPGSCTVHHETRVLAVRGQGEAQDPEWRQKRGSATTFSTTHTDQ
jgi:hypothetical protein